MIDISKLTVGEVAKIEELSGQPITAFADDDKPKALAMAALAFVVKRREDATFTWNAAQSLPFSEINAILGTDEEDTDAPLDESSPEPSASSSASKKTPRKH